MKLIYYVFILILATGTLAANAQITTLTCDDVYYSVIEKNQKQFVNVQLTPMYFDDLDIESELANLTTLDVKTAHYVNGDMAFSEIKPASLINFGTIIETDEQGIVRKYIILDLRLNPTSKAINKEVTATCSLE